MQICGYWHYKPIQKQLQTVYSSHSIFHVLRKEHFKMKKLNLYFYHSWFLSDGA